MSFSRTDSSPEAQRSGAAGVLLGYESSCFNHARYDALNRLATAATQSTFTPEWAQSYSYDGFGNLTNVTQDGTTILTKSYDANNHAGGEDANGNPGYISLPADGGSLYAATYDVENRLVATGSSTIFYGYAPGNKRVWKGTWTGGAGSQTRGTDEITFFSVSGQKLAAYALTTVSGTGSPQFYATQTDTNYYFGGKLIKNANGWVYSDRLASVGKFYPYGVERPSATTNGTEKFTGYFRDAETGNDYADQRYMSPGVGRFITPDRMTGSVADPGSWNKYAYAGGDPIGRVDHGGTTAQDCIIEDDCDEFFNDPLYFLTLLNVQNDPNSPCYGEGFTPSAACLASLWPNIFSDPTAPTQVAPNCGNSIAGLLNPGIPNYNAVMRVLNENSFGYLVISDPSLTGTADLFNLTMEDLFIASVLANRAAATSGFPTPGMNSHDINSQAWWSGGYTKPPNFNNVTNLLIPEYADLSQDDPRCNAFLTDISIAEQEVATVVAGGAVPGVYYWAKAGTPKPGGSGRFIQNWNSTNFYGK